MTNPLITPNETRPNHSTIGSIALKLEVAKREGFFIVADQTRYHKVVDGTVVTLVDESKPTYYYYGKTSDRPTMPLPMLDPYAIAMEFYLSNKEPK